MALWALLASKLLWLLEEGEEGEEVVAVVLEVGARKWCFQGKLWWLSF